MSLASRRRSTSSRRRLPRCARCLRPLPDEITSAPADEGWSPRDVVVHLASLDPLTMVGRVRAIVEQDAPVLPEIDENEVLEQSGLRSLPLAEVLDRMARQRARSAPVAARPHAGATGAHGYAFRDRYPERH